MLEVRNLFKALNGNEILKNINLRFETGVYGLLGANVCVIYMKLIRGVFCITEYKLII